MGGNHASRVCDDEVSELRVRNGYIVRAAVFSVNYLKTQGYHNCLEELPSKA